MDKAVKSNMDSACPCGSGRKYGECCGRNNPCPCGSGKKASECCFKTSSCCK